MTIRSFVKKHGWQTECDVAMARRMTVDINFENDGNPDETEFDIAAYNVNELSNLFADFCRENKLKANTVTGVTIVSAT